jgi:hypothetical protein
MYDVDAFSAIITPPQAADFLNDLEDALRVPENWLRCPRDRRKFKTREGA